MLPPARKPMLSFGPFEYDSASGEFWKHGHKVKLPSQPRQVLEALLDMPGELVTREDLRQHLWPGAAAGDFEHGLNAAVNKLRQALGDSADQPRYVETVSGRRGYRFIAPLRSAAAVVEMHAASAASDSGSIVADEHQSGGSARETHRVSREWKAITLRYRWRIAAVVFAFIALGGGVLRIFKSKPRLLMDNSATPSVSRAANDQYDLAFNFLAVQNDIPRARKTFERALELDPHFTSAHLQRALAIVIEIYNGYANDGSLLYQAEEDLHQAEKDLSASDGLLMAAQAGIYLGQGRLDRVPWEKLTDWRPGMNPVWPMILRMLKEQQPEESLVILRTEIERNPMDNVVRMFLGELLRTQGKTAEAVQILERVVQQGHHHPTAIWLLTMTYLDQGKPEQARALLERVRPGFEKNYMWRHARAILLAAEGNRKKALEAMDEDTLKFARLTWTVTSTTGDFYALQGDSSRALEWLQLAIARGDERVSSFRRNPRLASLRTDPRFLSLLKSVEARHK